MKDLNNNPPILDVPYFQQTRFSTCGPAALMMVMKYWDNSFELSKRVEFQLWMKSNPFIFLGGTLQFGLAITAMKMGFKTQIFQKSKFSECYSSHHIFFNVYEGVAAFNSRRLKVPIFYGREVLEVIQEALIKRIPPIVFLNLESIVGENVLHWIVVTGMNKNEVFVNDPYIPRNSNLKTKKGHPIKLEIFKKAIATDVDKKLRLPPCVILVYK